jgi:ubiquinone/menaquinone biosynthesis C-methylase UbiE
MPDESADNEISKWGAATETSATRYSQTNTHQHELGNDLSNMMKLRRGQHVLVIACGPGSDVLAIARIVGPEGKVVGVDLDKHSIDRAHEALEKNPDLKPYVKFHIGDAHDLSMLHGQYFHAIHVNASYHWFTDKPRFLAEAASVAKPGACIGIATIDKSHPPPVLIIRAEVLTRLDEDPRDFLLPPTEFEVRHELSTAGFRDIQVHGFYSTYLFDNATSLIDWQDDSSGNKFAEFLEEGKKELAYEMMAEKYRGLSLPDGRVVVQMRHLTAIACYGT